MKSVNLKPRTQKKLMTRLKNLCEAQLLHRRRRTTGCSVCEPQIDHTEERKQPAMKSVNLKPKTQKKLMARLKNLCEAQLLHRCRRTTGCSVCEPQIDYTEERKQPAAPSVNLKPKTQKELMVRLSRLWLRLFYSNKEHMVRI